MPLGRPVHHANKDRPAQDRKRKASQALRELATELHVTERIRNNDFTKARFATLLENVEGNCSTPDQRARVKEAKALYFQSKALPPVPALPAFASGASSSSVPLLHCSSHAISCDKHEIIGFKHRYSHSLLSVISINFDVLGHGKVQPSGVVRKGVATTASRLAAP